MFKTKLTELLGVEYPIVQGGMMWVSRAGLAAAVSNAGGLGILSAITFASPEELSAEIRTTRERTNKPFGVNITLLPTLEPIDYNGYIDVVIQEGIKIVETAGRSPEAYMERLKSAGVTVIHKCTSVRFARTAERIGCDFVSIDGFECGGHPGEEDVSTLVLVPLTVDAVKIPVIASGGFGDGRGLVAALALGAEGINMGTRFMATQEAPVHRQVKEALVSASEVDTMLILRSLRNTRRVLKNPMAEKIAEMEKNGASVNELAPLLSGERGKKLLESGAMDEGLLSVGQITGMIRSVPTVKELIDSVVNEAKEIISGRLGECITS